MNLRVERVFESEMFDGNQTDHTDESAADLQDYLAQLQNPALSPATCAQRCK